MLFFMFWHSDVTPRCSNDNGHPDAEGSRVGVIHHSELHRRRRTNREERLNVHFQGVVQLLVCVHWALRIAESIASVCVLTQIVGDRNEAYVSCGQGAKGIGILWCVELNVDDSIFPLRETAGG